MAYLDDTGLAYFWGKIKAWANSAFALLGHTHPASDVTLMTGYSKPASGSAIAASDTLNQAVGKLEAKADAALDDSNYVHKSGDETVAGLKTFTASGIVVKNTSVAKGEEVSNDKYLSVQFFDKNNLNIGRVLTRALSSGGTTVGLFCYDPTSSGDTPNSQLAIWWPKNGDPYAVAPSTPTGMTGNIIVTSDYIPRDTRIVHTTGNEVISGGKLFTGDMDIQSTSHAKGDAPANDAFYNFWVCDKNATAGNTPISTRFGGLELILYQDKTISTNLVSYVNNTNSSNSTVVGAVSHADGNDGYGFVRNGYFQTYDSNGYIVNANFAKGSVPSYSFYHMLLKLRDSNKKNVGGLYHYYLTNKENYVGLIVYNGTNGTDTSSDQEQIGIGYNSNGSIFTHAPTPASSSNDTNIATTAFVKAQDYVTRTTAQTITGAKTLTTSIIADTLVLAKKPNNNSYLELYGGKDSTSQTGGKLLLRGSSNSSGTAGEAILQGGDSSGYRQLIVKPDGIWFNTAFCVWANNSQVGFRRDNKPDGNVVVCAGSNSFDGASLILNGRTYSTSDKGKFIIRASTKSSGSDTSGSFRNLTGTPDGSIYWNGQAIQTSSDERLKRDFASVDDAVLDGWGLVDWLQFRFRDAVEEKGERARLHVGLVAQRVDGALLDAGVDVKRYGIVCHEYAKDYYHDNLVIDAAAYTDEEGVFHEEATHVEKELVAGRDEWTVRYTEALCMEAAYMRRENARLKKRVADLEDRLAALELRLGSE